jgi:hypothetical protein
MTYKLSISFFIGADQECLDFDMKKLQSFVKEKSLVIAEKGALAGSMGLDTVKSFVSLTDKPKSTWEAGEMGQSPEVKYQLGWHGNSWIPMCCSTF